MIHMATLAYHGSSEVHRLDSDLRGLAWLQRAVAIMAVVNGGLPWLVEATVQTAFDFFGQPAGARHVRLAMPNDMNDLAILSAVMLSLAAAAWMSARLIDRRRCRWVSLAVAVLEVWYLPFGALAAVRAWRLLFRRNVVDAYGGIKAMRGSRG